jgi:hypothetical protein
VLIVKVCVDSQSTPKWKFGKSHTHTYTHTHAHTHTHTHTHIPHTHAHAQNTQSNTDKANKRTDVDYTIKLLPTPGVYKGAGSPPNVLIDKALQKSSSHARGSPQSRAQKVKKPRSALVQRHHLLVGRIA